MKISTTLLLIGLFSIPTHAELDDSSKQALFQTQELLKSKDQRDAYYKEHPEAAKSDQQVQNLTKDKSTQSQIYNLSADIFGSQVKESDGNVQKQNEILNQAMRDPAAFYKNLSPEQKNQIKQIADDIEKQNGRMKSPQ